MGRGMGSFQGKDRRRERRKNNFERDKPRHKIKQFDHNKDNKYRKRYEDYDSDS